MTHAIKSNTEASRSSINTNTASVWFETLLWIFCGNSALNSVTSCLDLFLFKTNLFKRSTCSDHNLSLNNIDTANLFGDCMLNLNSWVHLNEIELATIILNQEFNSSCILISNVLAKSNGTIENTLSDLWLQS
jgi:hypothetical protein